jgi:G3E family GTPase
MLKFMSTYILPRQIAIADRIIINKKDLLSKGNMDSLENTISGINSVASVVVTERSR